MQKQRQVHHMEAAELLGAPLVPSDKNTPTAVPTGQGLTAWRALVRLSKKRRDRNINIP